MPLPADLFKDCKTHRQAEDVYRQEICSLQEALRQAHTRIVTARDAPAPKIISTAPQTEPRGPLRADLAVQRSHDALVRQWATQQGIVFRRVSKNLREMYDEAHNG